MGWRVRSQADHHEPSGLLLAYVDESYSTDRFYLGAILVDGAAVHRIETGLDSLVAQYGGRFGLPPTTELHGLVTFLHRRRHTRVESDERARAANELIWSHVAPVVEHEHCWTP
jgi:hypothetical protein